MEVAFVSSRLMWRTFCSWFCSAISLLHNYNLNAADFGAAAVVEIAVERLAAAVAEFVAELPFTVAAVTVGVFPVSRLRVSAMALFYDVLAVPVAVKVVAAVVVDVNVSHTVVGAYAAISVAVAVKIIINVVATVTVPVTVLRFVFVAVAVVSSCSQVTHFSCSRLSL